MALITGYLQEVIYKLSKVGQALENADLTAASSLLGPSTNADWVKNVNAAFAKVATLFILSIMYTKHGFKYGLVQLVPTSIYWFEQRISIGPYTSWHYLFIYFG